MTIARTETATGRRARALVAGVLLLIGTAAGAQVGIKNSAHDLGANSTVASGVRAVAGGETETCKFCHVPHRAQTTQLLWNRTYMGPPSFTWGTDLFGTPITTTSVYETQLPTLLRDESRRCLSCHDGSISIGAMAAGGTAAIAEVAGRTQAGVLVGPGKVIGQFGDLSGHHPVGVPYPGTLTYGPENLRSNVPPEKISAAKGGYWPATAGGCQSPSGVCTIAAGALNVNGANVNLVRHAPNDTSNVGVECTSCHDPHNRYGYDYFLRVNVQYDGLCNSCHNK